MAPDAINRLSRLYVLEVLFVQRDERGRPLFPDEPPGDGFDFLYQMAARRGLPHEQAKDWATKHMRRQKKRGRNP